MVSDDRDDDLADIVPLSPRAPEPTGAFSIPGLDDAVADLDRPTEAGDEEAPSVDEVVGPEIDDYDDYLSSTTRQYEGLAESVRAADESGPVAQNVSVHVAGVAGVAGFEDLEVGAGVFTAPEGPDEEAEVILGELEQERFDLRQLRLRILTAVALVGLLVVAGWVGSVWFVGLVGLLGVLALGEFYAAARSAGHAPVAVVGLVALVASFVVGYRQGAWGIAGVLLVAVVAMLLLYAVTPRRDPAENAAVTALGFGWVGLLAFVGPISRADGWQQLMVLVVATVAAIDAGAFFVGRWIGSTPLAPTVSPNKTVEGLAGGVVAGFAVALLASQLPWMSDVVTIGLALGTAAVAGLFAPLGDVAESLVKRSVGTKDMGTLLPGHGGVLDRLDSFLLVVPALYALFIWLSVIP